MRYIYGISTMGIFTLMVLIIVYKMIKNEKCSTVTKYFLAGLSLAFFMGPGWSTNYSNFALTDLWLPIISVLAVYLILKEKYIWIVPVLSCICLLIHTAYVFLYFNIVLFAFWYKIIVADKKKTTYIVSAIVSLISVSALFIYMMFFAHAREGISPDYVMARAAEFVSKTVDEIEMHRSTVLGYLFREGDFTGISFYISSYWLLLVVMIIMFGPFIYELCNYWKYVVTEAKACGRNKFLYGVIPFGCITTIPMYIMHCDYGRWTYAVFFYEFACIWILNILNDECIIKATKHMYDRIINNKVYFIVLLFYAGVSGAFSQNLVNPMISTIESYGWKIIGYFIS
jgi:hypothetical protein